MSSEPRHETMTPPSGAPGDPGVVLVVDDDDASRMLVTRWLRKSELNCIEAQSGEQAIRLAREMPDNIDAIVLDIMMPGIDGFEVVLQLKGHPTTALIPIVLITAQAKTEEDIVRAVECGAVDHISKPFSGPVLAAKVRALCERARADRRLRSKLRHAEENAAVDPLTSLFNRRQFEKRLSQELTYAKRHERPLAVVMFDLDHFKSINDTYSHEGGDKVLVHVSQAIRSILRGDDSAFRYGGEEFVILLRSCDSKSAVVVAERLRKHLSEHRIHLAENMDPKLVTFSAGIASAESINDYLTDNIIGRADAALYRAKRGGRDRIEVEGDIAQTR